MKKSYVALALLAVLGTWNAAHAENEAAIDRRNEGIMKLVAAGALPANTAYIPLSGKGVAIYDATHAARIVGVERYDTELYLKTQFNERIRVPFATKNRAEKALRAMTADASIMLQECMKRGKKLAENIEHDAVTMERMISTTYALKVDCGLLDSTPTINVEDQSKLILTDLRSELLQRTVTSNTLSARHMK